ncbi:hypothetical protein [Persicirhabdus sediminis]|uniref:Uncharacterized protein n=1 Tax=Persicirhabdus sediminis TaxID=454144 RepID=A0A8J7MDT1_9BACT|nr:hypothetical protein [Persicirhabdus sediminis]MBK1790678.1 hypothetical protein [Persicirhabdus sediminis]
MEDHPANRISDPDELAAARKLEEERVKAMSAAPRLAVEPRRRVSKKAEAQLDPQAQPAVVPVEPAPTVERDVGISEQEVRRKQIGKMRRDNVVFEKRQRTKSPEQREEEQWATEQKRTDKGVSGKFVKYSFFAVVGFAVVILSIVALVNKKAPEEVVEQPEVSYPYSEEALLEDDKDELWFHENSNRIHELALQQLKDFYKAEDTDNMRSAARLLRSDDSFTSSAAQYYFFPRLRLDDDRNIHWGVKANGANSYLILNGVEKDFMPASVYFVRDGDGLKIDWDASVCFSDIPFSDLEEYQENRALIMRGILAKRGDLYLGPYTADEYSAYTFSSVDKSKYVWVYVEKDSADDEQLKDMLNYGRFVMNLRKGTQATLKLARGRDSLDNQYELRSIVSDGWVCE